MHISFRNKCLIGLAVILAGTSFSNAAANPKTWTKDESGRVLVYRAKPSKAIPIIFGTIAAMGLGFSSVGLFVVPTFDLSEKLIAGAVGSVFSVPSLIVLKYFWYDEYNALHKPLIVIDKYGITYEGHTKILWKNVCGYRAVQNIVYGEYGPIATNYFIEISTDVDRLQIPENRTAITWQKLHQLIDEAYKTYKKLEKENAAFATV